MRIAILVASSALMVALFAGCTVPNEDDGLPSIPGDVAYEYYLPDEFPIDLDHDHGDPAQHVADFQVHFMAHQSCTPTGAYDGTTGGFTDMAFHDHFAFAGNGKGFCILDISDPTDPKFVSQYLGEPASDLEISPDGNYVLLLTQRNTAPANPTSGDPTDSLPRGAIIVNVKDKQRPAFESYYPVPTNGVHTGTVYDMDGRTIVSIQTYDWATPADVGPVPRPNMPGTQRIEITELKPDSTGKMSLQRVGLFSLPRPQTDELALWFPHDSYIEKHPITNQVLLYAAYWDAGLVIVDISDPANPKLVSRYDDAAPSKYNAYHDVKTNKELINGRHITVTGPELESAVGESGVYRIMDTTDPTKPVQLGIWGLPGVDGFGGGFQYSPHVFQVIDGRIYCANYHGGVWVIDIHNETLLHEPKTAGYYFPHGDEAKPDTWAGTPTTWGVYWYRGYMYASEETQGVHVLHWIADDTTPSNVDGNHMGV